MGADFIRNSSRVSVRQVRRGEQRYYRSERLGKVGGGLETK